MALAATVTLGPAAHADTITETLNTSAVISLSPETNGEGYYIVDSNGIQFEAPAVYGYVTIPFQALSVTVPDGSVITSASEELIGPEGDLTGTGYYEISAAEFGFTEYNPNELSVAPTFTSFYSLVIANVYNEGLILPVIDGNIVSFDLQGITVQYQGMVRADISDPGSNDAETLNGYGQVQVPYTEELIVNYTTPEPSTFVLLATGIVGLAGVARRRIRLANSV